MENTIHTLSMETIHQALPVLEKINRLIMKAENLADKKNEYYLSRKDTLQALSKPVGAVGAVLVFFLSFCFLYMCNPAGAGALLSIPIGIASYYVISHYVANAEPNMTKCNEAFNAKTEKISQQIYSIAEENQEILSLLPRDYRSYDAVSFFEHAFSNGRADSLMSAINLYELELHHRRLEQNSESELQLHQAELRMLDDIADSARTTATFTVLNYIFN